VKCFAKEEKGVVDSNSKISTVNPCHAKDCLSKGASNHGRPTVFGLVASFSQSATSYLEIDDRRRSIRSRGSGIIAVDSGCRGRLLMESVDFTDCETSPQHLHVRMTAVVPSKLSISVVFEAMVTEEFVHFTAETASEIQHSLGIR
jgi:hypothetical protein